MSNFSALTSRIFRLSLCFALGIGAFMAPHSAWAAKTLGEMTNSVYDSMLSLQFFLSLLSYILGIFFFITGFKQLRDHVSDPDRNPIKNAVLRLIGAAFFLFSPTLANMLVKSLGGGGGVGDTTQALLRSAQSEYANKAADGLDGALTRFAVDFGGPFLDNFLPFFAYVAGVILMMVGLKRLALANGEGPQAPGGMGTMGTFLVAAGLMAFGYIMYTFQMSIFGKDVLYANAAFHNTTVTTLTTKASQTLWGVFMFLRIVGYISVLRGLFMLRAHAEGGQVSLMAVATHMIAGALLANGGYFVNALQYTFIGANNVSHFVFNPI